ncbi:MAG: GNAT family N-acetyltransferase [bacterium]
MTKRMPKVTVRQARQNELLQICRLIVRTVNHLYQRVARPRFKARVPKVWPIMEHWFGSDPEGMLVAVNSRKQVVGHAGSIVREQEWYLNNLFVNPSLQSRGLGALLLDKSMEYGRQRGCKRFSLCTFAENPQAVALYTRFGMPAQRPVMMLKRRLVADRLQPEIASSNRLDCRLIEDEAFINKFNRLDRRARGIARPEEHHFWLRDPGYSTYAFFAGRRLVGYAIIHRQGLVGPLVAAEAEYLDDIFVQAINVGAAEQNGQQILFVQGERQELLNTLLAAGFKIDEVLLEMSSEKLANPELYVPGSLAYY